MKVKLKCDPKKLLPPPYPPPKQIREKPDTPYESLGWESGLNEIELPPAPEKPKVRTAPAKSWAYTPEQEQQIIDLYKQGMTYAAIGRIMGKSRNAMRQKLDRLRKVQNFEREHWLRSEYGGYTPAQDAVIREMRAQGKSYEEIGDQIGKSKEAVRKRYNMIGG